MTLLKRIKDYFSPLTPTEKRKRERKETRAKIIRMCSQGATVPQMADVLDKNKDYIRYHVKQLGLVPNHAGRGPIRKLKPDRDCFGCWRKIRNQRDSKYCSKHCWTIQRIKDTQKKHRKKMHNCSLCKETKNREDFYKYNRDGREFVRPECKPCHSDKMKKYNSKRNLSITKQEI